MGVLGALYTAQRDTVLTKTGAAPAAPAGNKPSGSADDWMEKIFRWFQQMANSRAGQGILRFIGTLTGNPNLPQMFAEQQAERDPAYAPGSGKARRPETVAVDHSKAKPPGTDAGATEYTGYTRVPRHANAVDKYGVFYHIDDASGAVHRFDRRNANNPWVLDETMSRRVNIGATTEERAARQKQYADHFRSEMLNHPQYKKMYEQNPERAESWLKSQEPVFARKAATELRRESFGSTLRDREVMALDNSQYSADDAAPVWRDRSGAMWSGTPGTDTAKRISVPTWEYGNDAARSKSVQMAQRGAALQQSGKERAERLNDNEYVARLLDGYMQSTGARSLDELQKMVTTDNRPSGHAQHRLPPELSAILSDTSRRPQIEQQIELRRSNAKLPQGTPLASTPTATPTAAASRSATTNGAALPKKPSAPNFNGVSATDREVLQRRYDKALAKYSNAINTTSADALGTLGTAATDELALPKLAARGRRSVVYHASPGLHDELQPRAEHGDPGVPAAIFATPHLPMALAYAGAKWGDRDIDQGSEGGKSWVLREMRPDALREIFGKGRGGYLYELPGESFKRLDHSLGSDFEVISEAPVTPRSVRRVEDPLKELADAGVKLEKFNPESEGYLAAVRRMARRATMMDAASFSGYLNWVREKNPELADAIKAHIDNDEPAPSKLAAFGMGRAGRSSFGVPGRHGVQETGTQGLFNPRGWQQRQQGREYAIRRGIPWDPRADALGKPIQPSGRMGALPGQDAVSKMSPFAGVPDLTTTPKPRFVPHGQRMSFSGSSFYHRPGTFDGIHWTSRGPKMG